jgi:hypothetical protein
MAPQLTHLDSIEIPSTPKMQDRRSYIWSILRTLEGNQSSVRLAHRFQFDEASLSEAGWLLRGQLLQISDCSGWGGG